jgi:hypothetical protein
MKVNLLVVLFLFLCQSSYSQKEKPLKGTISSDSFLLKNVDVINITSKKSTTTNDKGEFIIQAKVNDSLYFYAKEFYLKKMKLASDQIVQNNLEIRMSKIPEELEEVVIRKIDASAFRWRGDEKYEQGKTSQVSLDKAANKPKTGVYDGSIENGADLLQIGGMILGLFIKDKEPSKEKVPQIEFVALAKNTCDQKFYLETLKLKPDQIDLFLQFCDADPKSRIVIEHHNILSMMDFLTAKNIEFQKLNN